MQQTVPQDFERSEPNARLIAIFGAATLAALALIIVALQSYVDRSEQQQIFVKQLEPVSQDLRDLRAREDAQLNSYQYLDRARGTVRLPIDRAMELLVKEYSEGKLWYPTRPVPVAEGANHASD